MNNIPTSQRTQPIVLLDRFGYGIYRNSSAQRFFNPQEFSVRMITDLGRISEATGQEIDTAVGVSVDDDVRFIEEMHRVAEFLVRFNSTNATGIATLAERLLVPAAEIRERFSIPGQGVSEATCFRDKIAMKDHLKRFGIRVPEYRPFSLQAVAELFQKYDTIFAKPRRDFGARDVHVLKNKQDVETFVKRYSNRLDDFEVEEYIDGQLYHVDSVVYQGTVVAATAGRTIDPTTSYRDLAPCRDVAVPPGSVLDRLLSFNERVISSYEKFSGVTHHEIFLANGEAIFCEIAGRAGGGGVAAGFESRTGVNLFETLARAQVTGKVPQHIEVSEHLTGYVPIYSGPGVLRQDVTPIDRPWIVESKARFTTGHTLKEPTHWGEYLAIVTVKGSTEQEVIDRLDEVVEYMVPVVG